METGVEYVDGVGKYIRCVYAREANTSDVCMQEELRGNVHAESCAYVNYTCVLYVYEM